jgi:short subunit dehydrogenase-like uncharacterized protein
MTSSKREFDLVIWGASGFTGRLTAEYLLGRYGVVRSFRWAIGGRNRAKLELVRKEIGGSTGTDASALPILLGDSLDDASLARIAAQTRVICTTVGPYAQYGSNLVAACVRAGTDYCDLTGEAHWMRKMIETHQRAAAASGARIVHTAGFDCIPSDIGTYFVQQTMRGRYGVAAKRVALRVRKFQGGFSGGTIASMFNMLEEAALDPEVGRVMAAPYSLNPSGQQRGPDRAESLAPKFDELFGEWTAPFVMAPINTKVVRRTNALLGYAYGEDFRYDEAILTGSGPAGAAKAVAAAAGTALMMGGLTLGPLRRFAAGRLPGPGEGPSKEQRERGYFDLLLIAEHPHDASKNLRARVTGDRDPGYGSTSKMLGESAVCLATDALDVGGGFLTPASAMGDALLPRLQEHAGVKFEIEKS